MFCGTVTNIFHLIHNDMIVDLFCISLSCVHLFDMGQYKNSCISIQAPPPSKQLVIVSKLLQVMTTGFYLELFNLTL